MELIHKLKHKDNNVCFSLWITIREYENLKKGGRNMENASKALIIAGSVLIAILLIAMGVRVLTSSQGTIDAHEGTMKTTEISAFNSKFTQFVGTNKNKARVVSMLNAIITNNATNQEHQVTVSRGDPKTLINNVAEGAYSITILEYDSQGYITKMGY